jgi:hypothetical protein
MKSLLISLLVLAPVSANSEETPVFGGFAREAIVYPHPLNELTDTPVKAVTIGDLVIEIEKTPIRVVADALGGEIQQQGEAGEALAWLCYTRGERTIWFYEDGEFGGGKVNMVAVETTTGVADDAGCTEGAASLDTIDFGVPTIGADWSEVMDRFGVMRPRDTGTFGYRSVVQTPLASGGFFVIAQDLLYRRNRDGKIDAIGVLQVSEN